MIKDGFDKKEKWAKNGYLTNKAQQEEMLCRLDSGYSDEKWVLWIVAELFHAYKIENLKGYIEIKTKDGSKIEFPYRIRNPYPNKKLNQLSRTFGKKTLYGIPLVFDTYEEINEISEITIIWDIYELWTIENGNISLNIKNRKMIINYKLSFKENYRDLNYKNFTILSKDRVYDMFKTEEMQDDYYKDFDIVKFENGVIEYNNNCNIRIDKTWEYKNIYDLCSEYKKDKFIDKEILHSLINKVENKSEIEFEFCFCQQNGELVAEYMADILGEPSFGFFKI